MPALSVQARKQGPEDGGQAPQIITGVAKFDASSPAPLVCTRNQLKY